MTRVLIAFFLALCCVPMPAQTPQDYLHSLVGQKLLLRHFGNRTNVSLKLGELGHVAATCDVAVLVRAAEWKKTRCYFAGKSLVRP
jgi:hypothetical protein